MTMIDKDRTSLYGVFRSLQQKDRNASSFNVATLSASLPHKIGCSLDGMPMFFIESISNTKISDIKLEFLSVRFNRKCLINDIDSNTSTNKIYSIIQLNSENRELIKYFLDVVYLVLRKLPHSPSDSELRNELIKIIKLFSKPPQFSKEIVRGLWAELLCIEQAANPEYLIEAWHVSPEDKFDFNDGMNKVEIKSTSNSSRVHVFSLEQLNPNLSLELLIGSVFVVETGMGKTVFDIAESIDKRLTKSNNSIKLYDIILQTIGANRETVEKMYFDYALGVQSKQFYSPSDIPSIPVSAIPPEVNKVHFTSDLTASSQYSFSNEDCELFRAL